MQIFPNFSRMLAAIAVLTTSTFGFAQVDGVPAKLVGIWTTVDGKGTGAIELNTDAATGKGKLYVQSSYSMCTVKEAPATVSMEGEKLLVRVDSEYSNFCRKDISIEAMKKSGSTDYEGELRQGGRAKDRDPILRIKLTAQ